MTIELPHIPPGSQFGDIGASQWRHLVEQVKLLNRIVLGDNNTQRSASGVRSTARTPSTFIHPPAKTVVIVRKPVAGDLGLLVREAKYVNLPPKPCTGDGDTATCFYEWYGHAFEAYPPLGVKPIKYDGDENTADPATTPPKLTTKFHRCHREHDTWIVDPPPAAGGGETDLCLVHAPFAGGTVWGTGAFIRIVHVKYNELGGNYISAERQTPIPPEQTAPGYSVVRCWPGTDESFWQYAQSTQGTAPTFTPTTTAVYFGTVMIGGVEYIAPLMPIRMFQTNATFQAGDCG